MFSDGGKEGRGKQTKPCEEAEAAEEEDAMRSGGTQRRVASLTAVVSGHGHGVVVEPRLQGGVVRQAGGTLRKAGKRSLCEQAETQ